MSEQEKREVSHEHAVGDVLQKFDGALWKVRRRLFDVDEDQAMYELHEIDDASITEMATAEQVSEWYDEPQLATDGGEEVEAATDRVEPFTGEPADAPEEDEIPPAKEGSINQIPDLSVGDRVYVETSGSYAPDRTLTVQSVGSDKQSSGLLETRGEDPGYVLSGYGTEYHLITTGTPYWRAVDIVFPSQPVGQRVASVEVVEEGKDAE